LGFVYNVFNIKMIKMTDEQLVTRYVEDKYEQALEDLVKRYLPIIYGFVRNYTGNQDNASDITQEVFVKVWRNIKRFERSKSFRTWIFTIAKNTAIDWLKKKNALPFSMIENEYSQEDFAGSLSDNSPSILEKLSLKETSKSLALALELLPADYNKVINLHISRDLSFREIAESLKEPLDTVKSRYRRGLFLLKKIILKKQK
jgi:RNA polymerase sigma-70 factor (ECF subfamily)